MQGRNISAFKQPESNNELKDCQFCSMKGMKKDRIERKGLQRTIVFKCIYCNNEDRKTL